MAKSRLEKKDQGEKGVENMGEEKPISKTYSFLEVLDNAVEGDVDVEDGVKNPKLTRNKLHTWMRKGGGMPLKKYRSSCVLKLPMKMNCLSRLALFLQGTECTQRCKDCGCVVFSRRLCMLYLGRPPP